MVKYCQILFGALSEKKLIITFMFVFQAWHTQSNDVYAVQCSEEYTDFYS